MTFLDLIKKDLQIVDEHVNGRDEADISVSAYHCQQAAEKMCSYVTQLRGLKSIRTHDINEWIQYLEDNYIEVPQIISTNAEKLTSWGAKARYDINFRALRKDIMEIKEALIVWIDAASNTKASKTKIFGQN
jgi:HEPN domain-containing protein